MTMARACATRTRARARQKPAAALLAPPGRSSGQRTSVALQRLIRGQSLPPPSGCAPASRAIYGASTAQEDALTRSMRQGQAVGPRAAAFLQTAQKAIRLWVCKDEGVLEMPGQVRAFLQDAAGSATLWTQNLATIDRLQGRNVDDGAMQHTMYTAAQSLRQQRFSDAVRAACAALPTQSPPTTERLPFLTGFTSSRSCPQALSFVPPCPPWEKELLCRTFSMPLVGEAQNAHWTPTANGLSTISGSTRRRVRAFQGLVGKL